MSLAAAGMPHVYDKAGQDLTGQQYLDILKHSQAENARRKEGELSCAAGELADSLLRRSETRKNSTSSSGANPKAKKRMKKGKILPRLVEHLNIKDRSNSVPVLFPPLPSNAGGPQLWSIEDEDKVSTPGTKREKPSTKR